MKDAFDTSNWHEAPKRLLEKDVQGKCVEKARRLGWLARKFSSAPGNTSVPDYLFAKKGHVFFVEFKRPGGKPTPKQLDEHQKMRSFGLLVYVIDDFEKFDGLLNAQENLTP